MRPMHLLIILLTKVTLGAYADPTNEVEANTKEAGQMESDFKCQAPKLRDEIDPIKRRAYEDAAIAECEEFHRNIMELQKELADFKRTIKENSEKRKREIKEFRREWDEFVQDSRKKLRKNREEFEHKIRKYEEHFKAIKAKQEKKLLTTARVLLGKKNLDPQSFQFMFTYEPRQRLFMRSNSLQCELIHRHELYRIPLIQIPYYGQYVSYLQCNQN